MINISEIRTNSLNITKSPNIQSSFARYNLIPSSHISWSKLHEYSHKRLVKKYSIVPVSNLCVINEEQNSWKKSKPNLLKIKGKACFLQCVWIFKVQLNARRLESKPMLVFSFYSGSRFSIHRILGSVSIYNKIQILNICSSYI